jgi:hypothetical protein
MRRAERCFVRQGMRVHPASAGCTTFNDISYEQLLPGWRAIRTNELTVHELGGMLWYYLRGRI